MGGNKHKRTSFGFSIIEVIVVIVVIGILAAIITVTFDNVRKSTRTSEREADIEIIANALEKYYDENGEYPPPTKLVNNNGNISGGYILHEVLIDIPADSLVAPQAPEGTTNSITLLDDYTYENMTEDSYGYSTDFAANAADCSGGSVGCSNFVLFYKDEVNNELKSKCSQHGKTADMPCGQDFAVTPTCPAGQTGTPPNCVGEPIAWWKFNNNANDSMTGLLNGVVFGATHSEGVNGRTNGAYRFDGIDDYIRMPYNSQVLSGLTSNFSISAWVKKTADVRGGILSNSRITSDGFSFGLSTVQGLYLTTYGVEDYYSQSNILLMDKWHFVVGVLESNCSVSFYVDGVQRGNAPHTSCAVANTNDDLFVGRLTLNGGIDPMGTLNGSIDDVRLFNRALTQAEVTKLYNSGAM